MFQPTEQDASEAQNWGGLFDRGMHPGEISHGLRKKGLGSKEALGGRLQRGHEPGHQRAKRCEGCLGFMIYDLGFRVQGLGLRA